MTFTVCLNGTDTNPYVELGLTQNPFPQIAEYEYTAQILHLQALGGMPIPDVDYIRRHLTGWSPEFVEGCCKRFRKGEYVKFVCSF
jgi:hypothetical protein